MTLGSRQSMSDETLDRELAALFAVDPSPAFLPSVRARVDTESQRPAPWRWTWFPALAVVTLLLLFVGIWPASVSDSSGARVEAGLQTRLGSAPMESTTSASAPPAPAVPSEAALVAGAVALRAPQTRAAGRRSRRALPATRPDPFDDIQLSAAEQQVLAGLQASLRGLPLPDMTPVPRDADQRPVTVTAIAVADVMVARVVIESTALMAP